MKKIRNLSGVNSYADLLQFVHSTAALNISDEEAIRFYTDSDEDWKQTLLNACPPSPEVEKAIVKYGEADTIHLLGVRYGFYPSTIEWAMKEGSPDVAEAIVKNLKERLSAVAEELMVRRGEAELFKMYLKRFKYLEDDAEKVLNQDPALNSLLQLYIDLQS
jgi:hypothetical protein